MKFLSLAAIFSFAASVSTIQLSHQLRADTQDHANQLFQTSIQQHQEDKQSKQQGEHKGKGHQGKGHKGKGHKGKKKWHKKTDWKTWANPCPKQGDIQCWKNWFGTQLNCTNNDMKCWGKAFRKLPCHLKHQKCWTKHITSFPCKQGDSACWDKLVPSTLPCKTSDRECWKGLWKKWRSENGKNKKDKKEQAHQFEFEHQIEQDSYEHDGEWNEEEY